MAPQGQGQDANIRTQTYTREGSTIIATWTLGNGSPPPPTETPPTPGTPTSLVVNTGNPRRDIIGPVISAVVVFIVMLFVLWVCCKHRGSSFHPISSQVIPCRPVLPRPIPVIGLQAATHIYHLPPETYPYLTTNNLSSTQEAEQEEEETPASVPNDAIASDPRHQAAAEADLGTSAETASTREAAAAAAPAYHPVRWGA